MQIYRRNRFLKYLTVLALTSLVGCTIQIVNPIPNSPSTSSDTLQERPAEPIGMNDYFENVYTEHDFAEIRELVSAVNIESWEEHQKARCENLWSTSIDFASACLELELDSYRRFMKINSTELNRGTLENANEKYRQLKRNVNLLTSNDDALRGADLGATDFLVMGGSRLVFYTIALERAIGHSVDPIKPKGIML